MEYNKIILNRSFYIRDTSKVAKDILGKVLVKESGGNKDFTIKNTGRIGITNGRDRLLRYIAIGL